MKQLIGSLILFFGLTSQARIITDVKEMENIARGFHDILSRQKDGLSKLPILDHACWSKLYEPNSIQPLQVLLFSRYSNGDISEGDIVFKVIPGATIELTGTQPFMRFTYSTPDTKKDGYTWTSEITTDKTGKVIEKVSTSYKSYHYENVNTGTLDNPKWEWLKFENLLSDLSCI